MRIVSYYHGEQILYGVVNIDRITPVSASFAQRFRSIQQVLEADALPLLADDVAGRMGEIPISNARLALPLGSHNRIICVGVNYPKRYPLDPNAPSPGNIILFAKFEETLVPHGEALEIPPGSAARSFDYEGEIALVIGKPGRHIARKDAYNHVAGYTIINDGSVRDWQKHSVHAGKNFENSGSCGPWITTADEIKVPSSLELSTRLNGNLVQHATAAEMIFQIPELIEYISNTTSLRPGDLIATGSPHGSGGSQQPQRFLRAGDSLEFEVSGIGVLANSVGK